MNDIFSYFLWRKKEKGNIGPEEGAEENGEDYPEINECSHCYRGLK